MNILVTGGSGCIGSAMVRILSKTHTVFAPSHAELDTCQAILPYVVVNNIQCIVHAALNDEDEPKAYTENVIGIDSVLQCAPVVNRIFLFNSGIVYNESYAKEHALDYMYYIKSKRAQMSYVCSLPPDLYVKVKTIVLCGVYGPRERGDRFFSSMIDAALHGTTMKVKENRQFYFSYTDDIAKVVRDCLLEQDPCANYPQIGVLGEANHLLAFARYIRDAVGPLFPHKP